MAPESRNKSSNPIQRLLETEEKGRGLALFGWAGVTVFAFLAAFASWQFAPGHGSARLARVDDVAPGEITGGIRPANHSNAGVPTVPTPLPADGSVSKEDFEQLRAELKDLRRVVGRVDASTEVLARRMSNLEDTAGNGLSASVKPTQKPLQALTPITPVMTPPQPPSPVAVTPPVTSSPPASPVMPANPAAQSSTTMSPTTVPAPATPAIPPASVAANPPVPSQPPANPPQAVSIVPQNGPQPHPPTPIDKQAEKSSLDRNAVDRSSLQRMLMERSQGLENDNGSEGSTYIPPLPDPVSIVPKSRAPLVLPPLPLPMQAPSPAMVQSSNQPPSQPVVKVEPKPLPDVPTTGSVAPRAVLPIDPTKAVEVPQPPAVQPEAAKPVPPSPAPQMSAEDQKKAAEKLALAMREDQAAAAAPRPAEQFGIDLGGYKSIGQVKKVWSDLEIRQGKLTKTLTPLAHLGEANDGVEIRLVAGPFTDKEQAMRTCHQLRGATAKCDTIAYSGEPVVTKGGPEVVEQHRPATTEFSRRPPLKLDLPTTPIAPTDPTEPKP